ncbi:hypothetical protein J8273_1679 [Carpediemonas membranifera]|uniref:Thioredoxin n=1 Tax=Carpediemonas membranifera TaxID=201153 RepID=A0A8J6AWK4_9EUKA|nr:Thioredoxin [Carpediemonas membranifera]KAG9396661.1 hypothetical protein J8273_1679 [Carpediemonas membranifera]|eukprot:KAG9396656.1 Thioredoxin [Carpediemonas membranifera]
MTEVVLSDIELAHKVIADAQQAILAPIYAIEVHGGESPAKETLMTAIRDQMQQLINGGTLETYFPSIAKTLFKTGRAQLRVVLPGAAFDLVDETYTAFQAIKRLMAIISPDGTANPAALHNHLDTKMFGIFFSNVKTITLSLGPPLVAPPMPPISAEDDAEAENRVREYEETIDELRRQAELDREKPARLVAQNEQQVSALNRNVAERDREIEALRASSPRPSLTQCKHGTQRSRPWSRRSLLPSMPRPLPESASMPTRVTARGRVLSKTPIALPGGRTRPSGQQSAPVP